MTGRSPAPQHTATEKPPPHSNEHDDDHEEAAADASGHSTADTQEQRNAEDESPS